MSKQKKKKKLEFAKIIAVWILIVMTLSCTTSYVLSYLDKNPVSELSGIIVSTGMGYLVSYAIKSVVEKNSRNKYGIDEMGMPFQYRFEISNNQPTDDIMFENNISQEDYR